MKPAPAKVNAAYATVKAKHDALLPRSQDRRALWCRMRTLRCQQLRLATREERNQHAAGSNNDG